MTPDALALAALVGLLLAVLLDRIDRWTWRR